MNQVFFHFLAVYESKIMNYTELLGYFAAFCTTMAFLPQAIKVYSTKSTKDLSLPMFLLFVIGLSCWLIYGLIIGNAPMIYANAATLIFALFILYHKIFHG